MVLAGNCRGIAEDSRILGDAPRYRSSSDVSADNFTEKKNALQDSVGDPNVATVTSADLLAIERVGRLEQCQHYGAKGSGARCAHLRSDIAGMRASIRTVSQSLSAGRESCS